MKTEWPESYEIFAELEVTQTRGPVIDIIIGHRAREYDVSTTNLLTQTTPLYGNKYQWEVIDYIPCDGCVRIFFASTSISEKVSIYIERSQQMSSCFKVTADNYAAGLLKEITSKTQSVQAEQKKPYLKRDIPLEQSLTQSQRLRLAYIRAQRWMKHNIDMSQKGFLDQYPLPQLGYLEQGPPSSTFHSWRKELGDIPGIDLNKWVITGPPAAWQKLGMDLEQIWNTAAAKDDTI